jgi:cysteine-rich repeat protein
VATLACGEWCDDGNLVVGDGCGPDCERELIPGGGGSGTDCLLEWMVVNPNNLPRYDKRGRISRTQVCRDNDPTCDFDGGVPGSCTFHFAACANVADPDLDRCYVEGLASAEVLKPTERQAVVSSAQARMRAQLQLAAQRLLALPAGTCSPWLELTVPLVSVSPRVRTTTALGRRDTDRLTFICTP